MIITETATEIKEGQKSSPSLKQLGIKTKKGKKFGSAIPKKGWKK
jgi:hypothetical protein